MSPDSHSLQNVLHELAASIRNLPEEQRLDAFLASCSAVLQTLDQPTIIDLLGQLRRRFPQDDNEVLTLIEGHLAVRQLLTA